MSPSHGASGPPVNPVVTFLKIEGAAIALVRRLLVLLLALAAPAR